jgi:hypothetical protein
MRKGEMNISGYGVREKDLENLVPYDLAEIALCAKPTELRDIAAFLLLAANEMEAMGNQFSHLDLSDKNRTFEGSPHFVVFNNEN